MSSDRSEEFYTRSEWGYVKSKPTPKPKRRERLTKEERRRMMTWEWNDGCGTHGDNRPESPGGTRYDF